MLQSKLDPFYCIVIHGPKKAQVPGFERAQHLKEKSKAESFFTIVNRVVVKVYRCKKIFEPIGAVIFSVKPCNFKKQFE